MPLPSTEGAELHRTCLPEEQLILASDHEIQETHRYRGFELSFLPIDPAISQLMAELGRECKERLDDLVDTAEAMQMADGLSIGEANGSIPADIRRQHTFLVNHGKAQRVLSHALAAAEHSLHFHELLLKSSSTPELHDLLERFVEQKRNACRIIEEIREGNSADTRFFRRDSASHLPSTPIRKGGKHDVNRWIISRPFYP